MPDREADELSIPEVDYTFAGSESGAREQLSEAELEDYEVRALDAEAKLRTINTREIQQRVLLRYAAFAIACAVIVAMFCVLTHVMHQALDWRFLLGSKTIVVFMIVAPVTSITAVTIAIMVGAFRKFDDVDAKAATSGLSAGLELIKAS